MSHSRLPSFQDDDSSHETPVEPLPTFRGDSLHNMRDCGECRASSSLHMSSGLLTVEHSPDSTMVGSQMRIEHVPFTLGRQDCDVTFTEAQGVSRRHAQITFQDGVYFIADTGSTNHTFVDGCQLEVNVPTPLCEGAAIRLGAYTVLRFSIQEHQRQPGQR
jgi:FHA domain-containing protein